MQGQHTVFEYMYRDAGNFKTVGYLVLAGWDPDADAAIRSSLEWSGQFVAEQIGVPPLCEDHWLATGEAPSDLDHAFHEFMGLRPATEDEMATAVWGSLELLISRMRSAAGRWDVTLSPNCDL